MAEPTSTSFEIAVSDEIIARAEAAYDRGREELLVGNKARAPIGALVLLGIGIKQRGLTLRPVENGKLTWFWARWSLTPLGSNEPPP